MCKFRMIRRLQNNKKMNEKFVEILNSLRKTVISRNSLVAVVIKIITETRPKYYFVLENVNMGKIFTVDELNLKNCFCNVHRKKCVR